MKARSIALTPEEQADLELIVRRPTSAARDVFRAGVILRAAAGCSNEEIAAAMRTRPATASKWRGRFLYDRINGLQDAPRPANRRPTIGRANGASWRNWINPRLRAMRGGMESCWPQC